MGLSSGRNVLNYTCQVEVPSPPYRGMLWRKALKTRLGFVYSTKAHSRVQYTNTAVSCVKLSSSTFALLGENENSPFLKNRDVREREWCKWSMVLSYDGTKYSGWQIQPDKPTVQKTVEDALFKITRCSREDLILTAAGRPDAGVHAWGQVVHFSTPQKYTTLAPLHASLNSLLPQDIRIREVRAVRPDFHARYSAQRKTYRYKAYLGPVMDPFQRHYACCIPYDVDLVSMRQAACPLIGEHDFSAFANSTSRVIDNPVRNITKFSVELEGPNLAFEVEGTGFFYKQVRNMVGLLLEIGKGTASVEIVSHILESRKRKVLAKHAATAPPHGLYLMHVEYDDSLFYPSDCIPAPSFGYREICS